jgi:hypothetical protein
MSRRDLVYAGHMLDMAKKAVSKTQELSRDWQRVLVLVKPETVILRHLRAARLWRPRKSLAFTIATIGTRHNRDQSPRSALESSVGA